MLPFYFQLFRPLPPIGQVGRHMTLASVGALLQQGGGGMGPLRLWMSNSQEGSGIRSTGSTRDSQALLHRMWPDPAEHPKEPSPSLSTCPSAATCTHVGLEALGRSGEEDVWFITAAPNNPNSSDRGQRGNRAIKKNLLCSRESFECFRACSWGALLENILIQGIKYFFLKACTKIGSLEWEEASFGWLFAISKALR